MELIIDLPDNLIVEEMIKQEKIPCLCTVKREFNVHFRHPLPEAVGTVKNWDKELLEGRAPTGVGGEYSYFHNGMISLNKIGENEYQIQYLSLFDPFTGWCPVIIDGAYGPIGAFWGSDEDDIY